MQDTISLVKDIKAITFCISPKFLQSFDKKVAQIPIKFFSFEPPETISFSAFSNKASSAASSEAANPSSAFISLSCKILMRQTLNKYLTAKNHNM